MGRKKCSRKLKENSSVSKGTECLADERESLHQVLEHYDFLNRPMLSLHSLEADWVWNVMTHAQKPDFVFRRNGRVHLNRRGLQFSRLLAGEVCASAVVMLDTPCSEVVWRVLATHFIRQFPLHFPSRAPPCAITFQLDSTATGTWNWPILAISHLA
jgi:hypothetical protein